jgi:methionine-rich copper-binding protein CopC
VTIIRNIIPDHIACKETTMKSPRRLFALTALLLPLLAAAHSTATSTMPANGAVLKVAPTEFMLMFNEAAKLAKVTLQKTGDIEQKDVGPLPAAAAKHIMIPAPKLGAGEYTLRYRAVGDDGHVVPGVVKFSIAP